MRTLGWHLSIALRSLEGREEATGVTLLTDNGDRASYGCHWVKSQARTLVYENAWVVFEHCMKEFGGKGRGHGSDIAADKDGEPVEDVIG